MLCIIVRDQVAIDDLAITGRDIVTLQHAIYEEAIGLVCGDATGRVMGLAQVAHLLEIGHDVAYGRGTQALAAATRDFPGSHGLSSGDKPVYRPPQDFPGSLAQIRALSLSHSHSSPRTAAKRKLYL